MIRSFPPSSSVIAALAALGLTALALGARAPGARAGEPSAIASVASLSFLEGSWRAKDGSFETIYSSPRGGQILSVSKSFAKGGRVEFFEFERFEAQGDTVVLLPYPMGKRAETCPLVALEGRKATFENAKKDFPRRLVYERTGDATLRIALEGTEDGKPAQMVFELERAP